MEMAHRNDTRSSVMSLVKPTDAAAAVDMMVKDMLADEEVVENSIRVSIIHDYRGHQVTVAARKKATTF